MAFNEASSTFDQATPIYVDSNLGNGIKGEEVAKVLSSQGFSEIYLATGYEPDQFVGMPWLRGVIGKEPPWLDLKLR